MSSATMNACGPACVETLGGSVVVCGASEGFPTVRAPRFDHVRPSVPARPTATPGAADRPRSSRLRSFSNDWRADEVSTYVDSRASSFCNVSWWTHDARGPRGCCRTRWSRARASSFASAWSTSRRMRSITSCRFCSHIGHQIRATVGQPIRFSSTSTGRTSRSETVVRLLPALAVEQDRQDRSLGVLRSRQHQVEPEVGQPDVGHDVQAASRSAAAMSSRCRSRTGDAREGSSDVSLGEPAPGVDQELLEVLGPW